MRSLRDSLLAAILVFRPSAAWQQRRPARHSAITLERSFCRHSSLPTVHTAAVDSNEMWPPLPPGTPMTPLPKEYARMAKFEAAGPPGVPVSSLKASARGKLPLAVVHPVDLSFPGLRAVHLDPPVFVVDNFLSSDECDQLIKLSADPFNGYEVGSPTFSRLGGLAAGRTSTSWFLRYKAVPRLVAQVSALLGGVDRARFEEPQLARYAPGQQFKWHLDGVPPAQLENGGQRLATALVYLNDLDSADLGLAGSTTFRHLKLAVSPRKGMALLFFPAFAAPGTIGPGGLEAEEAAAGEEAAAAAAASRRAPKATKNTTKKKKSKKGAEPVTPLSFGAGQGDERTLHAGAPPIFGTKWIAQIWCHENPYDPKVPEGNCH